MSLREEKTAKKKEEILQSAVRILSEKGYRGTTMEEIAAKLLMTKGSVYYYFKDKQNLLFESQIMILNRSIQNLEFINTQNVSVIMKLRKAIIAHIEYAIRERSVFVMMFNPEQIFSPSQLERIFQLRDEYGKGFDRLIKEGIESDVFRSMDVKIVRNIILGAINWVTQCYSDNGKKDETEMAELIADYVMQIVIKNKG
ncbi:TetR/AcrR family transcriptional regulator [Virgibacillus sp. JSM 102003]|uniref:TetR/AcrR family transcriptional regulator n=1 Tax=Virgibacillus sp. JSM 102003 TaxID=1562108 RepID=UPI0035C020F6